MERDCVFASVGDRHAVAGWLDAPRPWRLVVAHYGEDAAVADALRAAGAHVVRRKGSKFQNLLALWQAQPALFEGAGHVWVADDDLVFTRGDVAALFEAARTGGFALCQPAFDVAGKLSFPHTAAVPGFARLTNFIEMTAPLFTREALERFLAVYDGSVSGWGADHWFCRVLEGSRIGIIDAVTALNPHDAAKGGREIDRFLPLEARIAQWLHTAARLGLVEVAPRVLGTVAAREAPHDAPISAHEGAAAPRG